MGLEHFTPLQACGFAKNVRGGQSGQDESKAEGKLYFLAIPKPVVPARSGPCPQPVNLARSGLGATGYVGSNVFAVELDSFRVKRFNAVSLSAYWLLDGRRRIS